MPAQTINQKPEHVFDFNPTRNGGESLIMVSQLNCDGNGMTDITKREAYYLTQEICLASYRNSASFSLDGIQITPEKLRRLADELEKFIEDQIKENIISGSMIEKR